MKVTPSDQGMRVKALSVEKTIKNIQSLGGHKREIEQWTWSFRQSSYRDFQVKSALVSFSAETESNLVFNGTQKCSLHPQSIFLCRPPAVQEKEFLHLDTIIKIKPILPYSSKKSASKEPSKFQRKLPQVRKPSKNHRKMNDMPIIESILRIRNWFTRTFWNIVSHLHPTYLFETFYAPSVSQTLEIQNV